MGRGHASVMVLGKTMQVAVPSRAAAMLPLLHTEVCHVLLQSVVGSSSTWPYRASATLSHTKPHPTPLEASRNFLVVASLMCCYSLPGRNGTALSCKNDPSAIHMPWTRRSNTGTLCCAVHK